MNNFIANPEMSTLPPSNNRGMFPRAFTVSRGSIFFDLDFKITPPGEDTPSNYVAHHSILVGKPSVVLHAGPDESTQPLASAKFHTFKRTIDFSLDYFGENQQVWHEMTGSGHFQHKVWSFDFQLPNGQLEHFEWKKTGSGMIILGYEAYGLDLVRVQTGEVLATYAKKRFSLRNKGEFAFTTNMFGEAFELVAVVTMLAIVIKMEQKEQARD